MKKTTILICSIFGFGIGAMQAQYTNLLNFNFNNGGKPLGSVTLSAAGDKLFGMTLVGGQGYGNVFSVDTDGTNYLDMHDFYDTNASGSQPYGSLVLSASANLLYGMTTGLGGTGSGNIFCINTNGSGYRDLRDFGDTTDGGRPYGSLVLSADGKKLYGMTFEGGVGNLGNVFSVDTDGTGFKDLLDFNQTNGEEPMGALILSTDGKKLFGMAGGGFHLAGIIFSIDTGGAEYHDLLDFDGTNGSYPAYGALTLSASGTVLYGMTDQGGVDAVGNVFSIDTDGTNYHDLIDFNNITGEYAEGTLTLSDSVLYGMTLEGGAAEGNIFSIDTNGNNFSNLFSFNTADGSNPHGAVTLNRGSMYGMCENGGANGDGVVFKWRPTVTGTSELTANSEGVNVYPNPSNGKFTMQLSAGTQHVVSIEIYNMLGEKVHSNSYQLLAKSYQLDLSSQPNGVYLYRVIAESGSLVGEGKIEIER